MPVHFVSQFWYRNGTPVHGEVPIRYRIIANQPRCIVLDELESTETIDQDIDVANNLRFRSLLTIDGPVKGWAKDNHVIALALAETCCQLGFGKIRARSLSLPLGFEFSSLSSLVRTDRSSSADKKWSMVIAQSSFCSRSSIIDDFSLIRPGVLLSQTREADDTRLNISDKAPYGAISTKWNG